MATLLKITKKQQEIITLLYKFRFLNRIQIQAFLNHKDYRRINEWLKDLTEKQYIERIYSNTFIGKTIPAIYYMGINGIRYLKTSDEYPEGQIRKLYREDKREVSFIERSMLLAEICLQLRKATDEKNIFKAATKTDLADPDYRYNFLTEYNVDLVFAKGTRSGKGMKKYYLVHYLDRSLPRLTCLKRIRKCFELYLSSEWEAETDKPFPLLLFVCEKLPTLIHLKRYTRRLFNEEYENLDDLKFQFTTKDQVLESGFTSEIWEEIKS
jgi:hypothetical protein